MASVHAHSAHISAAFISTLLMILDVMVMVAAAMAIYQCIDPSSIASSSSGFSFWGNGCIHPVCSSTQLNCIFVS